MDVKLILKTIDEMYGLSEEYPDQMFDVTSTKYAVVLQSAAGEQFQALRSFFSDNELTLLDTELSRTSKSNTNLVYCTSNNDPNNLDKINQAKKDVMNLELILRTIDEMYNLSDKYPDQLFDVISTKNEVVLCSTAGEQFHILRSSFSDNELSLLDNELHKASERKMNLIYRTTMLDYSDSSSEDDLDDVQEDSASAENEMVIFQRLDEAERENKKLCCCLTKKEFQKFMEKWADNTVKNLKDYKIAIETRLDKVNRKVDELSGNLEELDIIRHNTPVEGNNEDNTTAKFSDLRDLCCDCKKVKQHMQQAYSNAAMSRFKYRKNKRCRNRNLIYQKDNNKSNLNSEFRKRKCTDAIIEADQKKQKLDRRKGELLYV